MRARPGYAQRLAVCVSGLIAVLLAVPGVGVAQGSGAPVQPHVVVSASADVELTPDQATLTLSVESRGSTAARAAAETARKQRAVLDTLRGLGVAAELMTTARLDISPEYAYPGQGQPPRITGYTARSAVQVEIRQIDRAGSLIDAALVREASGVSGLRFGSSKAGAARLQALQLAVEKAKEEASAMAKAANGTLGALLELGAVPAQRDFEAPVAFERSARMLSAQAPEMPVSPGMLKYSASVNARWVFIPK